jgi:hypothetical protein
MQLIPTLLVTAAAAAALVVAEPANAQNDGVMISSSALASHAGSALCDVNFKYGANQVTCPHPDDPGHAYATASYGPSATPGQATTATTSVHEDGPAYFGGVGFGRIQRRRLHLPERQPQLQRRHRWQAHVYTSST